MKMSNIYYRDSFMANIINNGHIIFNFSNAILDVVN